MAHVTIDDYIVTRTTDSAVLVQKQRRHGDTMIAVGDPIWLPRSQCEDGGNLEVGETDISVAEWIADDRGLDY